MQRGVYWIDINECQVKSLESIQVCISYKSCPSTLQTVGVNKGLLN